MNKGLKDRYKKIKEGNKGKWYIDSDALEDLGIESYKAEKGPNYIRLLPQRDPDADFFREIHVHYDVGGSKDAFLCPRKMYDEPCSVCEYADTLRKAGESRDTFLPFYPSRRFLFFIVDVFDEKTRAKGIQLYDAPVTIMNGIIGVSEEPRTGEIIDISDPDEGFNLVFKRTGTDMKNTRYEAFQKELPQKDVPDRLFDEVPTFDEVLLEPDVEAMDRAMEVPEDEHNEVDPPRRARQTETEAPQRGRSRGRDSEPEPARTRRREPEPESEPDRTRRREPEPAEEPPRRVASRRRDPEPSDEPEPAPTRTRRREPEPAPARRASTRQAPADDPEDDLPFEDQEGNETARAGENVRSALRRRRR